MSYDVCIVGSGAAGGAVAYMCAMAGLKTLVLEKGPAMAREDFTKDEIACCRRNLYAPDPYQEFHTVEAFDGRAWVRTPTFASGRTFFNGSMLGGASNLMSGFFHRLKPDDFRLRSRYGAVTGANVVDWPIGYDALEPWYALAERLVGVSGTVFEGPFAEWRSTPAFPWSPTREHPVAAWFDRTCDGLGYRPLRTPRAILPEASGHREGCYYSNFCGSYGCSSGAKGSSREALLMPALATGNLQVRTGCHVTRLLSEGNRVTGAEYVEAERTRRVEAKLFVVAAQPVESVRLLFNSASAEHPDGLGNGSGQLGKNLIFSAGGTGEGRFWRGRTGSMPFEALMERGSFVNRALQEWYELELPGRGRVKGGLIEFLFEHANPINRAARLRYEGEVLLWGTALQKRLENTFRDSRTLAFEIFCDWLPTDGTFVALDPEYSDRYGMPVAKIRLEPHDRDLEVARVLAERGEALLRAMGAESVTSSVSSEPPSNLVAGGCRFGDDPERSVLDRHCRSHEIANLFVADASFMPTGGSVPYTWTVYANALRVGDYIVRNFSEPAVKS